MAFASTVSGSRTAGAQRCKFGTFSNGTTDSGGAITTGLHYIADYHVTIDSAVDATAPKVTISGGTLTINCEYGLDGVWDATGV